MVNGFKQEKNKATNDRFITKDSGSYNNRFNQIYPLFSHPDSALRLAGLALYVMALSQLRTIVLFVRHSRRQKNLRFIKSAIVSLRSADWETNWNFASTLQTRIVLHRLRQFQKRLLRSYRRTGSQTQLPPVQLRLTNDRTQIHGYPLLLRNRYHQQSHQSFHSQHPQTHL